MFINHSPASTMNHHQPWMVPFRRASRMLRTFRATKLQWKMHHTWIPIPWEHRGGDLGRPWKTLEHGDLRWELSREKYMEKWGDGKNIWIMKTCFFFLHADEKFGTLGELPPSMRWQALIPQHDEDRTREKRYSWNTVWLFNVANWNITILLIGKSLNHIMFILYFYGPFSSIFHGSMDHFPWLKHARGYDQLTTFECWKSTNCEIFIHDMRDVHQWHPSLSSLGFTWWITPRIVSGL